MTSRRSFIKKAIGTALITGVVPSYLSGKEGRKTEVIKLPPKDKKKYMANDRVNVGVIGFNNLETTTKLPGIKLVGVCDLYNGRLDRAKELYGKDIFATKNYQE